MKIRQEEQKRKDGMCIRENQQQAFLKAYCRKKDKEPDISPLNRTIHIFLLLTEMCLQH